MKLGRGLLLVVAGLGCSPAHPVSPDAGQAPGVDAGGPRDAGSNEGDAGPVGDFDAGYPDGGASFVPAWLQGVPLNRWIEVPGTVLAGSPGAPGEDPTDPYSISNRSIGAYSGMALREDTSEIWVAASGGHSDSSDNTVRSLALAVDAPQWKMRLPASAMADRTEDTPYYTDGTPSSRHVYWSSHWSSTRGRVMLHRTRFCYGTGVSFDNSNGFDPVANAWDPQGTWSDGQTAQCRDSSDNVWAMNGTALFRWTAATDTWAMTTDFGGDDFPAGPMAFDSSRNQLFALAYGDGQGYGTPGLNAWVVDDATGTQRQAITFNASAAYTQFLADAPAYSALDYDPDNDRYLFFAAQSGAMDRIYVVQPNPTTIWDMSLLAVDPASVQPVPSSAGGLMNKFRYVPGLKGFVLFTSADNNVYFMRTK